MRLGYSLSSEEWGPLDLVRLARQAEEAGFEFALISDHFHPWNDEQGQSPFVWAVIGAVATATERLRLITGVTCPFRIHPANVAQAAATAGAMMEGRFVLGLGSGEALNEHVTGIRWPSVDVRQEMLEDAVVAIRKLWRGELCSHYGPHFTVEDARIYTLPRQAVPVYLAAGGERAARLAGRLGDGLICTAPAAETVMAFEAAGGAGKPRIGQLHVCWGSDEAACRRMAHRLWPNSAIEGGASTELPLPGHFEKVAATVREEDVAKQVPCGPDPERVIGAIRDYEKAGFDHVSVHQIGPEQAGFFDFWRREIIPALTPAAAAAGSSGPPP